MKLNELATLNPTRHTAKVFESYFGNKISLDSITKNQAKELLNRVRNLVSEHRRTPEFHSSEKNPTYLKLIMLEQALTSKISEATVMPGQASVGSTVSSDARSLAKTQALQAAQIQQKKRQIQDVIKLKQKEIADLQRQMNNPIMSAMEEGRPSLKQRLKEASEIQQAQVVLASQDMVDQVQKMSEQVSAMQFKDLPALVDQIKNEVGVDQATQFNGDASAALSGLLQNLQGAKQQLESALGVVTGQAPVVPGEDVGLDNQVPAELPAPGEEEIETDVEVDDEEDSKSLAANLGRGRR